MATMLWSSYEKKFISTHLLYPVLWIWILIGVTTSGSPHHDHGDKGGDCVTRLPELNLASRLTNPGNIKVMVATCTFPCDPKFVPEITIIPCTTAQQCDQVRPCLDKGYKEENKEICWTEDFRGSPELEYRKYGINGVIRCTDKTNTSLQTTDFILKSEAIPGRKAERESLLRLARQELLAIGHLDGGGSTSTTIYVDGVRAFYRHGTEKIWASPSRFFFNRKCDWILRHHDGHTIDLYKDNGVDQPFTRETIQFQVPDDPGVIVCSVKWYNSTARLEKGFPFTVIDPLEAKTIPSIDKSKTRQKFAGFGTKNKIECPFSGGDGIVTWFSKNETFANESQESYRNLLSDGKLSSVKEVKYLANDYPDGKFWGDEFTCVVKNEFGTDVHSVTLGASQSQSKLNFLMTFIPSVLNMILMRWILS